MAKDLVEQRLTALFAAACLLFNFPLLVLWDRDATLAGVPLFPAALFFIWALLITALAWIVERSDLAAGLDAKVSAPVADSPPRSSD